jgi:alcohol dehydrogenase
MVRYWIHTPLWNSRCWPTRDIPLYAEAFMSGRLPVDRLLTGEIDFENLNEGFDDLDDGVGVRQILNCGL